MKAKTLIPIAALCLGGSPGLLLADQSELQQSKTMANSWNVSQVMDASVKDNQGDNLGRIKDVVLDPVSGKATFAIIQLSGDVGPSGAFIPIPWAILSPSVTTRAGEPRTFTLNVDRAKFASSQTCSQWPDDSSATWGPQVYSYYGLDSSALGDNTGGTGASAQWGTGSDTSVVPQHFIYDTGRYGPTRADGMPIDNGSAPDGKGTFVRGLHWY